MASTLSGTDIMIFFGSGTIAPLPWELRRANMAVGFAGLLSFLSCLVLFIYITHRVVRYRGAKRREADRLGEPDDDPPPAMNLDPRRLRPYSLNKTASRDYDARGAHREPAAKADSNSFLTLIHNLMVADMVEATAVLISLHWWQADGIFVPSIACTLQGFLISFGSLSVCFFPVLIAVNAMLAVVWGFKLSNRGAWIASGVAWMLAASFALSGLAVSRTVPQGADGYYARNISLCWINSKYTKYGFWLMNFWVVVSVVLTLLANLCTCIAWLRNKQLAPVRQATPGRDRNAPPELSGNHPAFLVYPIVFVICSAPVTLCGILAGNGVTIDPNTVGNTLALSASSGLWDAILWAATIYFSSSKELEDIGLAKFDFARTPDTGFGNMVWVEGAGSRGRSGGRGMRGDHSGRKWWKLNNTDGRSSAISQHSIHEEDGIHLDTITSVTVDYMQPGKTKRGSYPSGGSSHWDP